MKKNSKYYLLLLLPGLLIMVGTVFLPIIRTFIFSLQKFNLAEPNDRKFIGLKNYKDVILADDFRLALTNSLMVVVLVTIIALIASMFVALLLNKQTKITPALTAIAIIPWALPPLVNGMMWKFIFYPGYGFLNKILIRLALIDSPISFTNNIILLMLALSMAVAWRVVPFCSIVLLANMQNIPYTFYEAARIDGSSKIQEFIYITMPFLKPSLKIVLVNILMNAINIFDEVIAMVGYRLDSQTLLVNNYLHTFNYLDFGYGSAITYVIMIISGILGYAYIKQMGVE